MNSIRFWLDVRLVRFSRRAVDRRESQSDAQDSQHSHTQWKKSCTQWDKQTKQHKLNRQHEEHIPTQINPNFLTSRSHKRELILFETLLFHTINSLLFDPHRDCNRVDIYTRSFIHSFQSIQIFADFRSILISIVCFDSTRIMRRYKRKRGTNNVLHFRICLSEIDLMLDLVRSVRVGCCWKWLDCLHRTSGER